MKNFGKWLLKNNIHVMTVIFICVAIWSIINWGSLALIQKLNLGAYFWLILHEYEEGYKNRFTELFAGVMKVDPSEAIASGQSHLAQAVAITLIFIIPAIWPQALWAAFAGFILCIFEGFVHNMGIFLFRLKGLSPGWYTAVFMAAFAIWAIVFFNAHAEYDGIHWLLGSVFLIVIFAIMQGYYVRQLGSSRKELIKGMKAMLVGKNVE